jgi:hypothetical protein
MFVVRFSTTTTVKRYAPIEVLFTTLANQHTPLIKGLSRIRVRIHKTSYLIVGKPLAFVLPTDFTLAPFLSVFFRSVPGYFRNGFVLAGVPLDNSSSVPTISVFFDAHEDIVAENYDPPRISSSPSKSISLGTKMALPAKGLPTDV